MNILCNYSPAGDVTSNSDVSIAMSDSIKDFIVRHEKINVGSELQFYPIDAMSMEFIMPYLSQEKGKTTDFSYLGLLMWVGLFKYEYAILNDTLFIKGRVEDDREKVAFALPIGKMSLRESMKLLREYCKKNNIVLEFSAVPQYAMAEMMSLNPISVSELEDWGDYLYSASDLSSLSGKKYGKKRNHVNKFIDVNPDWHIEKLTTSNIMDAKSIMDIYDSQLDAAEMGCIESRNTRQILDSFDKIKRHVVGIVLYVEDKPVAFTIGDIKGDTLFVHIEKALRDVPGCYEMINNCFAKYVVDNYPVVRYINREDDSGDEGLRKSKLSYHPLEILKKYNVIF